VTTRRFAAGIAATLALVAVLLAASGRVLLPADYLAWYSPFHAYPAFLKLGDFVSNHGLQDGLLVYYPHFVHLHEQLRSGTLPLWNPLVGVGAPQAALHGNGLLFPVHWLSYGLLPPVWAWHLEIMAVVMIGALSAFCLLRRVTGSGQAACFGAVPWAFSGWSCAYLMVPTYAWTLALFPLTLLGVERAGRREPFGTAQVGICAAGILLAGHLQVTVPAVVLVGVYAVWRSGRERWRCLAALAAAVVIALPHLIPLAELLRLSERTPISVPVLMSALLVPREYLCMVFPTLLGQPRDNFYFAEYINSPILNGREHCVFAGVVTLALALLAVRRADQRSHLVLGSLVTFGLVLAGAPWLYGPVCQLFPPLQFLTPTRFLPFLLFGVCWLASHGWKSLEDRPLERKEALTAIALLGASLVGAMSFILPAMTLSRGFQEWLYKLATKENNSLKPPFFEGDFGNVFVARVLDHFSLREPTIAASVLVVLSLALICWRGVGRPPSFKVTFTILAVDLAIYATVMNVPVPAGILLPDLPDMTALSVGTRMEDPSQTPERAMALRQGPDPNLLLPYGIANFESYQSVHPGDYRALIDTINQGNSLPHQSGVYMGRSRLSDGVLDLLGIGKLYNKVDAWDSRYGPANQQLALAIQDRKQPLRAFLCDRYVLADRAEAMAIIMAADFEPRSAVVLDSAPGFPSAAEARFQEIAPTRYRNQSVSFEVRSDHPTMLVLTDLAYPGWTATVNGAPAQIHKAYGFARAVELSAGSSTVELSFQPTGFPLTPGLALLALILLLGTDGYRWRRAARDRPRIA
jgi:hypothetical protein